MSPVGAATAAPQTFDPLAPALAANFYRPVPLRPGQKNPIPNRWQDYVFATGDEKKWAGAGVGLLTGEIVAIDVDILDGALADLVSEVITRRLGPAPMRVGRWPKRLFIYRTPAPFTKKATRTYRLASDPDDAKGHRIEALAQGQQFVAFGIHPDTGKPYEWSSGGDPLTVPVDKLTTISETQVNSLLAELDALLANFGMPAGKLRMEDAHRIHSANESQRGDPEAVRAALEAIPNPDLGWDDWIYVGLAIKGALGDEGSDAWDAFSKKSKKYDPVETAKQWAGFKPKHLGAGTIFHLARKHGWAGDTFAAKPGDLNYQFALNRAVSAIPEVTPVPLPVPATAPQPVAPSPAVFPLSGPTATVSRQGFGATVLTTGPLFDIAEASASRFLAVPPKPRIWLLKDYLPAGVVGSVIAPGGTGKSQLVLQLTASVAAGLPFCDTWETGAPGEVLALLAEDDEDEIHRRLSLIARRLTEAHKKQDVRAAIERNLYVRSVVAENNLLTSSGLHREMHDTGYAARIVATVRGLKNLKLIVLDPASRFRGGDENSAEDVTRFIEALERIRKETGATVIVIHHANKASMQGGEQTQAASRGSSAFSDGIRWQMNLAGLSEDEAKGFGVPATDRRHYLSVTMTKNNYAPPQPTIYLKRAEGGVLVRAALDDAKKGEKIMLRVVAKIASIGAISADRFEKEYGGLTNILGVGERALRGYIHRALEAGYLSRPETGRERPLTVTELGRVAVAVLTATDKNGSTPGSPAIPGKAPAG